MAVLVAGEAVKDNELLDSRWDKNDTKDSANVADFVSQGKCLFYENPEADMLTLRNLLAVRRIYNRILEGRQEERGIKTKACVKIAAKMLVIAWTM